MNIDDVTFCITYYRRPHVLAKLIDSIGRYHPTAKIDVQDTEGNLSWGRNELVKRCRTRYYFMLEEDMEFCRFTKVKRMKQMLRRKPGLAGISGGLIERGRVRWKAGNFNPALPRYVYIRQSNRYAFNKKLIICHYTSNWGLFRVEALEQTMWDERLELAEHEDFFYRLWKNGWEVGCAMYQILHWSARPSRAYNRQRGRLRGFRRKADEISRFRTKLDKVPWKRRLTDRGFARWSEDVWLPQDWRPSNGNPETG